MAENNISSCIPLFQTKENSINVVVLRGKYLKSNFEIVDSTPNENMYYIDEYSQVEKIKCIERQMNSINIYFH